MADITSANPADSQQTRFAPAVSAPGLSRAAAEMQPLNCTQTSFPDMSSQVGGRGANTFHQPCMAGTVNSSQGAPRAASGHGLSSGRLLRSASCCEPAWASPDAYIRPTSMPHKKEVEALVLLLLGRAVVIQEKVSEAAGLSAESTQLLPCRSPTWNSCAAVSMQEMQASKMVQV